MGGGMRFRAADYRVSGHGMLQAAMPECRFASPTPSLMPHSSSTHGKTILGLSKRTWLIIVAAFVVGVLLFLLIWARQRHRYDFYRPDAAAQSATGEAFEPLPVPDTSNAGNPPATPTAEESPSRARIVETTPTPAAPAPVAPAPQPMPNTPSPGAPSTPVTDASRPVPISSPAPRYPPDALRRGESGETLLRIHVGIDGVPDDVDLVRGSGSRSLDRAAMEAVRAWRFRPAVSNGQPVAATVQVPIAFNPGQ
jgi:protein TonB